MKKKMIRGTLLVIMLIGLIGCSGKNLEEKDQEAKKSEDTSMNIKNVKEDNIRTIYLGGGCFWGVEGYFTRIDGIVATEVGYANGKSQETNYQKINQTDHSEVVKLDYDMSTISLEEILLHYFRIIDPKSLNKQGNDEGRQYRTGVYYIDEEDLPVIDKVFAYQEKKHGSILVEKEALKNFVIAEEYHQDYLEKNPTGYCHIDLSMAKDPLFNEDYQLPEEEELKDLLDSLSYSILRENATERPGTSELNNEYRKGIYVDKLTGQALFSSRDKFDSGCGWPSFSKPILTDRIDYKGDKSHGMDRIEVRSNAGDNHLGHVFEDGPIDRGGLRYCINGAALRFIPYEKMEEEGYKDYMILCD